MHIYTHLRTFILNHINRLTVPCTQGTATPIVKIPNRGPCATAPNDIDSWSTAPSFSTTKTNITQIVPNTATTPRMIYFVWRSLNGLRLNGLKKSSNITADMELSPVDRDDKAAENTPTTKRPGSPGNFPNLSITRSGKSWSFFDTSLVVNGSQSWYVA